MPLFEYVLLALLGSGATGTAPANTTLGADAIVQPSGGVSSVFTTGQEEKKEKRKIQYRRVTRHRKHGRHGKHASTPKKDGGKKSKS